MKYYINIRDSHYKLLLREASYIVLALHKSLANRV